MLGRRSAVAAVVALFAVTASAQTNGGSACPAGDFLYITTQNGRNYTMTLRHPSIASGMTISGACSSASFLGASMVDGSGSGTKGYQLECKSGTVQLSGINCQGSSSVSGSSSGSPTSGGGTTSGGIGPVCDEENWPDKDHGLVCGDCKVLVNFFDSYYKTCDGYCQSMGMACAAAWEESNDDCVVRYNMTCDQAIQSSDALCECKKGTGVVVKPPCTGDNDIGRITAGALTSCAANASLCRDDAPAVAIGAAPGWFQKNCCATCGGARAGATTAASGTATTSATGAPKLETCLDVKKEYQRQGCCGMPTKMFDMGGKGMQSGGRRLSQETLLENVKLMLEEARLQGGASHASNMAADLINFLKTATQEV